MTETLVVSTTVHPVAAAPTVSNISGGSPATVLVTAGDDVGSGSWYDSAPVYVSGPSASGVSGPSSSSSSANANTNAGTNLDSIIPSSTSGPTFSFGTSAGILSSSVGVADLIAEGFASELILAYTEAKAIQNTRQDLDVPYRSMQQMMGYLDNDPVD
ncbi:hypothetical protein BDV23DRAFT_180622 [Aspergillus alliaceus]|uniref:Uncharacterized protein n=1 Tax=Petromyces alliaceus TaxID=209559 RepID=A0A5N7CI69_PETAA|nr:hypothetical protein BDV23DRAFT_180622 [Aspergillus alliaceus]